MGLVLVGAKRPFNNRFGIKSRCIGKLGKKRERCSLLGNERGKGTE